MTQLPHCRVPQGLSPPVLWPEEDPAKDTASRVKADCISFLVQLRSICHSVIINKYFNIRPAAPEWRPGCWAFLSPS